MFGNDNFIIGGKSLLHCYNLEAQNRLKFLDETFPSHIEFNPYYKKFVVTTKFDMRIYNPENGRLENVFTQILPRNNKISTQITSYSTGPSLRKFYVGDNIGNKQFFLILTFLLGNVIQYAAESAAMIREVNNFKNELPMNKY